MPELLKFSNSLGPLRLARLMLRVVPGQRNCARVSINDAVDDFVKIFQRGFALGSFRLICKAFAVVGRESLVGSILVSYRQVIIGRRRGLPIGIGLRGFN